MHIIIQVVDFLIKECQLLPDLGPLSTGPTIRLRKHNITLAYNFYSNFLEKVWNNLGIILQHFLDMFGTKGEFIIHNGTNGNIIDLNHPSFYIQQSQLIEGYFYEQEIFLYLRILWESNLQESDTSVSHQWISLDVDVVLESAWFVEEKFSLNDLKKTFS